MRPNTILPSLLLHVCCAPCASACVERLIQEGRHVTLYYSNSNLASEEEYAKRLFWVERLAAYHGLELLVDPYDHAGWLNRVSELEGYASFPEGGARCERCFGWSLGQAAAEAERRGMNFCTSLTVSPHKNSRTIFEVGARWSHFEPYDFKKKDGFKRSLELSARFGFYRQAFCGCEYSLRGRDSDKKTSLEFKKI